ncbi:MAG: iron-containing alcohol dehydrogenase [Candidatus Altiarchaeales archaeon]|nr:iron-containing alcohol dehydrogenase [Candidatus Altiarchaeales archaeon]
MTNYYLPTNVRYGLNTFSEVEVILNKVNPKNILLFRGSSSVKKHGHLDTLLGFSDADYTQVKVNREPDDKLIEESLDHAQDADIVIGLGGGSVLDAAKAVAVLAENNVALCDVLEDNTLLTEPSLPFLAIPTTSGTGSEVTRVSVVSDTVRDVKISFRSKHMYPDYAVVDPALTLSCPRPVTASTGLDALTHALESYTSRASTPVTELFAYESLKLIEESLLGAYQRGDNIGFRQKMAKASLFAGMALSNSGVGMCHGIAHAIGHRFRIPHGVICGFLLPYSVQENGVVQEKYSQAAQAFGLSDASQLTQYLFDLNRELGLKKTLSEYGVGGEDLPWIAENSFSGSMRVNPKKMTKSGVSDLLARML